VTACSRLTLIAGGTGECFRPHRQRTGQKKT